MTTETATPEDQTATDEQAAAKPDAESAAPSDPADTAASESTGANDAAAGEQPEIPEAYRTEDGKADLAKLIERVQAADAEAAERAKGVPETVEGYEIKLADDLRLPDGSPIQIDKDNPLLKEFLQDAHSAGKTQEQVSRELSFFAKELSNVIAGQKQATEQQIAAEIAKIDPDASKAERRFEAVRKGLSEAIGDDGASALFEEIRSAGSFAALEQLHERLMGQSERDDSANGGAGVLDLSKRLWGGKK